MSERTSGRPRRIYANRTSGVPAAELARIHGPAGLDIGARNPQEIAVSIAAELLAVRAGVSGESLRDLPGPVHLDGLRTSPPRDVASPG